MIEANKIAGEAKSLMLDNGIELTYYEMGEQNAEVVVSGAFYFHTWDDVLRVIAQKYHVYGVVMRMEGAGEFTDPETGSIDWTLQWGKDVDDFAKALGLEKFHYVGKCHGTVPGWYLAKNRPEALSSFASYFLAPHCKPQNSNRWLELSGDPQAMMAAAMRKPSGLKRKMEELASLGDFDQSLMAKVEKYAASSERLWAGTEECEEFLRTTDTRIEYLFGTEDPLYRDHYDSNIYAMDITRHAKSVILGGERHLMELDVPERIAKEAMDFFADATDWYVEDVVSQ